jgi:hypothetical protein
MPEPDEKGACASYCEMRITFKFGEEVPFGTQCSSGAGGDCSLDLQRSVSTTTTWEINTNIGISGGTEAITGSFDLGASYSWSKSIQFTVAKGQSIPLEDDDCAYWTWLPYLVEYDTPSAMLHS